MATVAGTVQSISGKFYAKDGNGNTRELSQGDEIYENDTVFGDDANTNSQKIEVALENSDAINLNANQEQLFDSSVIETAFGSEELYFPEKSVNFALRDAAATDIVSDLRDTEFKNEQPTAIDEEGEDVTEEETAEGEEEVEDETEGSGNFEARDGDATDIVSDLRSKDFQARTQVFEDKEAFKSESENRLSTEYSGTQYTNPPVVSAATPPTSITPPATPPAPPTNITPPVEPPVTPPTNITPPVEPPVTPPTIITPPVEPPVTPPTIITPPVEPPVEPPVTPPTPPPTPRTIIKIVAAGSDGTPLKDGSGNYLTVNEAPEGGEAYYVALAFKPGTTVFNDTSKLDTQEGTIDFTFTDGTATRDTSPNAVEGSNDYRPQTTPITDIQLGSVISVLAIDDYVADDGEQLTVQITNFTPAVDTEYGVTTISNDKVTTTITDNSKPADENTPHNPNDTPNHTEEGDKEIVMIKLFAADENGNVIKDGSGKYQLANSADEVAGSKANYIAYAFEDDENTFNDTTRLDTQVGQVNVVFADGTATGIESSTSTDQSGNSDYNNTPQTIKIGEVFSTEVFKDTTADLGETYTVQLKDNTYASDNGSGYESVNTDTAPVTTTIKERLYAKIEVLAGDKDVTNEGAPLQYTITIVDEDGNPITLLNGGSDATVHLNYEGISVNPATKKTDYTAQDTVIVSNNTNNTIFTLPAIDDYFAEGDEMLQITIDKIDYNNNDYSIKPHTIANGANADTIVVDGTIKDNPASVKETTGGTGEDVPGGTPTYGTEDTVYVKLTKNDSVIEGNTLTHTVTLVDKDDNPITVPAGETITVTLAYSDDKTVNADFKDGVKTTTVTITGGNSTTVSNITIDDFTAEGTEDYTLTITDVAQANNTYENVAIHTQKTADGEIIDGVTLGTPTNARVDEDDFDMASNKTTITNTKSLNIVSPTGDNAYTLSFDGSPSFTSDNGSYTTLTSNGTTIEYVVSGNTTTAYAGTGRTEGDRVFVITLDKNNAGGADDSYTYTQYKNIDHPTVNVDDDVVLTFGYKITDQGQTSNVENFTVTVNDSLPSGTDQTITLNEDTTQTIYISDESFKDGKITLNNTKDGDQEIIKDGTINIYDTDKNDVVGTLKNNGDGTLTFTPNEDYSGATAGFTYNVSDGDGDTASATVGITVKPVADAPTLANKTVTTWEDANITDAAATDGNKREGGNVKVLGLEIPVKKDQIDQNDNDVTDDSGTTLGDNPERLGAIEFSFATSGNFGTATIGYDSDGNGVLDTELQNITKDSTFTIDITDVANYHVAGTSGTYHLTQAQYESIAIMHDEDNAKNIKTKIAVASHEVKEDGSLYDTDIVSSKASQIVTLDVKAVTDDISPLEFNTGDTKTHTYTIPDNTNEGTLVIDVKSLLKNQVLGDNDGSEKRWYEISGLEPDSIVTLGTSKATVDSDGNVKINFPDNKEPNPQFTIEFPEQYSAKDIDLEATITLKVQDTDGDSTVTPEIKTDSVTFNITGEIDPVADLATIQVSQAVGFEDAGRSEGNTVDKDGTIDKPEDGIPLEIKVSSDDKDGSETFDVTIKDIPKDSGMYVYDKSTTSYKLVEVDASGNIKIGENTVSSGVANGNIKVTYADDKYSVEIVDFQNGSDKAPKFIPPHNDDTDYTLNVSATTKDGGSVAAPTVTTIDVIVKNVADAPVGTELKPDIDVNEDNQLNFNSIYKTPANLASYDDSEVLTVKIELTEGFTIDSGSPFYVENGLYVVKASDITAGNIKLNIPKDFSGSASFDLTYVTTEKAGENDSKTWHNDTVSIFVNPIADNVVITTSSTIYEDADGSANKLNLKPTLTDTGTTHGTETIDSVKILATEIPAGYELYLDSEMATSITTLTQEGGYYVLTAEQADSVYAKNTTKHDLNGQTSFDLNVVYTVTDTNTSTNTNSFTHTHTVNVKAVTDDPTLTLGTIDDSDANISASGTTVTVSAEDTSFTVPVTTTSDDKDSSEAVTKIVISGVPMGVEVTGATYYGYSGSEHNGIWEINAPTDSTLDGAGALENITFKVNTGANFDNRDITITTYTKDSGDAEVKSDSKTFTIEKSYTPSGTEPGTPADLELASKQYDIVEDTQFTLADVLVVSVADGGTDGNGGAVVTFTDIPKGSTVSGYDYSYVESGKTFYVVTGNGNAADMNTELAGVKITTPKDMNSGQDGALKGDFTFTADIATHHNGGFNNGDQVKVPTPVQDIDPLTDEMTIDIGVSDINEDQKTALTITLSNPSDGTKTELIGSSLTIKIDETWNDTATSGEGTKGTLTQTGTEYIINESPAGTYTITKTDGSAFPIGSAITGLEYTPASNRDGSVSFEVGVKNKETGSTVELDSTGTATITVTPVIDTVLNATVVTTTGTEDVAVTVGSTTLENPVKLEINSSATPDGSESFGNIVLDEVPNGFTVWYKDASDNLVMATNVGTTGGTDFNINPGITPSDNTDNLVTRNKWLVPATSDGSMPEVYINAPENWAGEFYFKAKFAIKEENLATVTPIEVPVTGKIEAVADDITIAPTLTFGDAFSWVDLKLNANMKDIDGSETMSLEITGLNESAQFRLDDGTALTATLDGSTWKLDGIAYDQINNIQFVHDKDVASVGVKANTVDGTSVGTATDVENFELNLSDVSGNFKLDAGLSLNFDNIGSLSSSDTLKNIDNIDLTESGANNLLNLSLQDVLDMSGSNKEIKITGIAEDQVSFKNETGSTWTKGTTETDAGKTYDVYSNSGDSSVKVKVETTINDGITS